MGLHGGAIDEHLGRVTTSARKRVEEIDPHTLRGPANIAVIERLPRPYSGGASTHRPPDLRTWMIPLITRRSSTRGLPRVSLGKCGSFRANCPSVSQNWSRFICASSTEAVNYKFVPPGILYGSGP